VKQRMAGRRTAERNGDGRRLLLSCLSRLVVEPQCIKPDRAGRTISGPIDPVLISQAVVEETLSQATAKRSKTATVRRT
jgi:hypothetical protein